MNIETVPKLAINNIDKLEELGYCGCYHCIRVFEIEDIINTIDNGNTALCPNCGVAAILPGMTNSFFLEKAYTRWFK